MFKSKQLREEYRHRAWGLKAYTRKQRRESNMDTKTVDTKTLTRKPERDQNSKEIVQFMFTGGWHRSAGAQAPQAATRAREEWHARK